MESMDVNSFCFGGLYGFITAGIIAVIANQIRMARGQMGLRNRSLDNFPDGAQPNLTPSRIVQNSWQAAVRYAVLIVLQLVVIGLTFYGVYLVIGG